MRYRIKTESGYVGRATVDGELKSVRSVWAYEFDSKDEATDLAERLADTGHIGSWTVEEVTR